MDRGKDRAGMAAPIAVLEAAISQLAGDSHKTTQLPAFIASQQFSGPKPGYVFRSGSQGVGYYLDPSQQPPVAADGSAAEEQDEQDRVLAAAAKAAARPAIDADQLLREAEEQAEGQITLLDSKSLKRLILQLEKRTKDNLEARLRHADDPSKFMDSEVDLCAAIEAHKVLSATPELYKEFVALGGVGVMLQLLGHENNDIVGQVAEVFCDLTDEDAVEDQLDDVKLLVDALISNNAHDLLVQRLAGMDESIEEEEQAVHHVLALFENMAELDPSIAETLGKTTKLLKWLTGRVKKGRKFTPNKQYAAEVLAILVQSSPVNQRLMGEGNAFDVVLEAVAPFKNKDPENELEEEFIDNLFDVVCCCLMVTENKPRFVQTEGIELMVLMLKNKRYARAGVMRTLDFACTRCIPACERFVDKLGLRCLFPLFMGKSRSTAKSRAKDESEETDEQRAVSIVASLFQALTKGGRRERVAAKFVENEFEKCDRLMELYDKYEQRMRREEARMATELDDDEEMDEESLLMARLDAGLFTLQQVCLIIGHLWLTYDAGIRKRVLTALHQRGDTLATVRQVLLEFRKNIGTEDGVEERNKQRKRLWKMLVALGGPAEPPPDDEIPVEAAAPPLPDEPQDVAPSANGLYEQSNGQVANGHVANGHAVEAEDVDMEVDDFKSDAPILPDQPPVLPPTHQEAAPAPARVEAGATIHLATPKAEEDAGPGVDDAPPAAPHLPAEPLEGAAPQEGDDRRQREKDKKHKQKDRGRERDRHESDRRDRDRERKEGGDKHRDKRRREEDEDRRKEDRRRDRR